MPIIPCVERAVHLRTDQGIGVRAGRAYFTEKEAILGYSFLVDNSLTLAMRGGAGKLEGVLLAD
jgi:hypothetical protein